MIESLLASPFLWLTLTLGIFLLGNYLYGKWPIPIFNPLLFTILIMILLLTISKVPYKTYDSGGRLIGLFITPATVALAIKLEQNFIYLKKYYQAILVGIISGVVLHTFMILGLAFLFQFDAEMVGTLIPKSITTAIAVSVSESLNGVVSLTVALVVLTGIVGAVIAPFVFKVAKIKNPVAQGVALGAAAHALGTTKAIELGEVQGAMAGVSIIITGITVVILTPITSFIIQRLFY